MKVVRYFSTPAIQSGTKRLILIALMFAVSSSRREKAFSRVSGLRMAATEQGRRRNH
jgi:hypothetical protein